METDVLGWAIHHPRAGSYLRSALIHLEAADRMDRVTAGELVSMAYSLWAKDQDQEVV